MSTTGKPLNRAVAAFNSLITQASAIVLKEIGVGWPVAGGEAVAGEIDILAHVEVYGRSHFSAALHSGTSGRTKHRS